MPQEPYLNTRQDAGYRFLGVPTLTRATSETTDGAFGMIEHWDMPLGFASPYHTHHREDECFYVLEGKVAFVVAGKWLEAGPRGFCLRAAQNCARIQGRRQPACQDARDVHSGRIRAFCSGTSDATRGASLPARHRPIDGVG